MPKGVSSILNEYVNNLVSIYASDLKTVILYGSYARGDFNEDSDIDIMILVDLDDEAIQSLSHDLSDATYDFNCKYDVLIMPIVKNKEHFEKWLRAYPFYNAVNNEGVELYAA